MKYHAELEFAPDEKKHLDIFINYSSSVAFDLMNNLCKAFENDFFHKTLMRLEITLIDVE